jgi:hypothetical protein
MYYFTDPAQGKKPHLSDDPKRDELQTKAQIVAFVKKCVQDGADVIKAKGDKGMNESVAAGGPRLTRISDLAYGLMEHSGEHYGQLVVYYRANSLVPPESRPKKEHVSRRIWFALYRTGHEGTSSCPFSFLRLNVLRGCGTGRAILQHSD